MAVNVSKNVSKKWHENMQGKHPRKKKWSELSPTARFGTVAAATVQLSLLVAAQRDIALRPAEQIRGSKSLWRFATLVNFIGPATYFTVGVKRSPATK